MNFRVIEGAERLWRPPCLPALLWVVFLGVTFQESKRGEVRVSTSYENGVSQRQCPGTETGPSKLLWLSEHTQVLALSHQSRAGFPSPSPYKFNTERSGIDCPEGEPAD